MFLDEIQATPYGIAALRYFYEERPALAVVAAGSLLEFALADHSFSMPVGRVEYLNIGPMTFMEYLLAMDEFSARELDGWNWGETWTEAAHLKLLKQQRNYLMIGGMPEAVAAFKETQSLLDVSDIHRSICSTYLDDFSKYAKQRDLTELQALFRNLPAFIGKKLMFRKLLPEASSTRTKDLLLLLERAKLMTPVPCSHANGISLGAESNAKFRKPLFLDVGLVSHLLGLTLDDLNHFSDVSLVNEGPLAEQFIGQQLLWGHLKGQSELFYWA